MRYNYVAQNSVSTSSQSDRISSGVLNGPLKFESYKARLLSILYSLFGNTNNRINRSKILCDIMHKLCSINSKISPLVILIFQN